MSWTRRLMMPMVILTVAVVLWSTGSSGEEGVLQVQGMVEGFLGAAGDASGNSTGSFIEREAVTAIAELDSPRNRGQVENLSDHLGQRYACVVTGSRGRSVRLEFSGSPPTLRSFHRISAE